jgi:hypothetical protein
VPFTVRLADGSEHQIEIDGYVLRNGDCIALSMAIEHQEAGRIPRGDILSVRRVGI